MKAVSVFTMRQLSRSGSARSFSAEASAQKLGVESPPMALGMPKILASISFHKPAHRRDGSIERPRTGGTVPIQTTRAIPASGSRIENNLLRPQRVQKKIQLLGLIRRRLVVATSKQRRLAQCIVQ